MESGSAARDRVLCPTKETAHAEKIEVRAWPRAPPPCVDTLMGDAIYDTGVVYKLLFTTPRHACGTRPGSIRALIYVRHRATFAAHAPDRSGTSTTALA